MRRRFGADVVLAVVLPLACAAALLVLQPDRDQPQGQPPVETPLTSASVVCPGPLPGAADVLGDVLGVSTLGADVDGDVQVGLGDAVTPLRVRSDRLSTAPASTGPVVVTGADDLAPGLVAGRSRSAPLAAVDCAPPVPDQWFTAVGAGATHDSVVELVNPNSGPAIADIIVRSPTGIVDAPSLRGVSVPGGSSTTLDLGQIVPRQGELSLEVHTSRGRLTVHVVDSYDELGTGTRGEDWLPSQSAPDTSAMLLGLAAGVGERRLVVANPGPDEVRATVQVVTASSVFAPSGVEPIRIDPDSTAAISLDDVLSQAVQDGATGMLIEATGPVTAALRQVVDGDVSLLSATPALDETTAAVLPAPKGKPLDEQRIELNPGGGADLTLPDAATLVTVTPERTSVHAAVLLTGTGTAAVPLRELVLTGRVPDVRPGVP